MKKILLFAAVATMFAACTNHEETAFVGEASEKLYVATNDDDSRVQLSAGRTVWTKGDRVSVFYKTTGNECYQFIGNTGDTRGSIMKVSGAASPTAIDKNIVIYPYNKDYELDLMNNTVSVVIPSTQYYSPNSYGVGANVMVASSSNNSFNLKNICGWLKLQFTGNTIIKSIKIKGNNNEQLAGTAIVDYENFSTFCYGNLANSGDDIGGIILPPGEYAREITLDCGDGVRLSGTPTEFYIAIAPQTLSKGISITAECDGNLFVIDKSTDKSITIARNHILPVANIDKKPHAPNNEIRYTSSDGNVVTPYNSSAFGASIVSNTCENGIGRMVFDGNVTKIGYDAFYECSNLTNIAIPNSITSIGNYAFQKCRNLTSIAIPDSVTSIGYSAFDNCTCLTSVTIPNNVISIDSDTFRGCNSLTSITIPDSVTSIGNGAFYGCSSLKSINIPDSVTIIGNDAFAGCSSLTCFTGKYSSADHRCLIVDGRLIAFAPSGLTEYIISNSVTEIESGAFRNCSSLTSITIPDSVTSIGDGAFRGCNSLTSITIPDSVTSIGYSAFYGCSSITNTTIGNGVTSIGGYAFYGCSSLTSITIPNSVTKIGEDAFADCSSLTSVTMPNSITEIKSSTFSGCSSLKSITIPDSITSIGSGAFTNCSSLTSITISDSVTSIGSSAFYNCISLTSVTIPDSVNSIGAQAFWKCNNLISITIGKSVTSIGKNAFYDCTGKCRINCNLPNANSSSLGFNGSKFTKITIGNGVTSIGNYALYGCLKLTSITIPDSITSIGQYAFAGCSSLTSIAIGNNVISIGERAFYDCKGLTEIYCKSATPPVLGDYVFYYSSNIFSYMLPYIKIYVPTASVEAYKTATNWKDYAYNIVGYDF